MGGNKLSLPVDKRIVIIGGGYGGASAGSKLLKDNHPNFTLIDGREAMHHNVASGRASLQKGNLLLLLPGYDPITRSFVAGGKRHFVLIMQPVYICVCVCACINIYIYIYMYIYIYIYIHICVCVCVCVCVCA